MEHTTRPPIGTRIKAARQARGFTASELARKAGVTENAIRKLEAGDIAEPRLSTGLRIAKALGTNTDFLTRSRQHTQRADSSPELASVIREIRRCRDALMKLGVEHVGVFGSVARGEADPESDVDVIIEPSATARFTLFDLVATRETLQHALNHRVDVVTKRTVQRTRFAKAAQEEAVSAF